MGIVSKLNKTIKEYNKETALTYLSILQLCKEKRQKRHKSVNFFFSKPVFFYKTPPLPRADGKGGVLILRENFSRRWPDGCRQYRI